MADTKKITALTAVAAATATDLFVMVDNVASTPVTMKITVASLFGNIQANAVFNNTATFANTVTFSSTSAHTGAATFANTVTVTGIATLSNTVSIGGTLTIPSSIAIYAGSATTRLAVRTQVGTAGANGSIYLSTAGKMYIKVNIAGADTDWQKATTTAAD